MIRTDILIPGRSAEAKLLRMSYTEKNSNVKFVPYLRYSDSVYNSLTGADWQVIYEARLDFGTDSLF